MGRCALMAGPGLPGAGQHPPLPVGTGVERQHGPDFQGNCIPAFPYASSPSISQHMPLWGCSTIDLEIKLPGLASLTQHHVGSVTHCRALLAEVALHP